MLSVDVPDPILSELEHEAAPSPELSIRSERVRLLLKKIVEDPRKSWSADEVQARLLDAGTTATEKYAANTLRRLYEEGLLTRVSRGLYRASDQLIAAQGVSTEDYD